MQIGTVHELADALAARQILGADITMLERFILVASLFLLREVQVKRASIFEHVLQTDTAGSHVLHCFTIFVNNTKLAYLVDLTQDHLHAL